MSPLLSKCREGLRFLTSPFPLTLTLSLRERFPRTLMAHCALEPPSGPLTPSLSPSEGERVPEGREREFMGREWGAQDLVVVSRCARLKAPNLKLHISSSKSQAPNPKEAPNSKWRSQ